MDENATKTGLDAVREQIDTLDAQLRDLLVARARLVEDVARSKAHEPATTPLRPAREIQQMQALVDWHASQKPPFGLASLLAVWREIIGAALVQQGGLDVHVCGQTAALARDHFGTALQYHLHESAEAAARACDNDPRAVAVVPLDTQFMPTGGADVFARLPILQPADRGQGGGAHAGGLCYGAVSVEPRAGMVTLVRARLAHGDATAVGRVIARNGADTLVEIPALLHADEIADKYGPSVVWLGNYDLLHVPDGQEA